MKTEIIDHFRRHKELYIGIGIGLTVGIASILIFKKVNGAPSLSQTAIGFWKPKITQIATQIVIDAPGNSGNVIQDLTTGIVYPSQNAAAKALGINRSRISEQLNGAIQNAEGHIFKKIIDGGGSHELQAL